MGREARSSRPFSVIDPTTPSDVAIGLLRRPELDAVFLKDRDRPPTLSGPGQDQRRSGSVAIAEQVLGDDCARRREKTVGAHPPSL
jgi:hypothetical protein